MKMHFSPRTLAINFGWKKISLFIAMTGVAIFLSFKMIVFYYIFTPTHCIDLPDEIVSFSYRKDSRGIENALLNGKAPNCLYATPASCPYIKNPKQYLNKTMVLQKMQCSGGLVGEVVVIKSLKTINGDYIYTQQMLNAWTDSIKNPRNYFFITLTICFIFSLYFIGVFQLFKKAS